MVIAAASFGLLESMPVNFSYPQFAGALLLNGVGMGPFAAPNRTGIMNALPPNQRGVGAGMSATFQNSAMVLSIGIFFSLMITGLAASLPHALTSGPTAPGVTAPGREPGRRTTAGVGAVRVAARLQPHPDLLGNGAVAHLSRAYAQHLTGHRLFPALISAPFSDGLRIAFDFAIAACLVAAVASWLRGAKYVHSDGDGDDD